MPKRERSGDRSVDESEALNRGQPTLFPIPPLGERPPKLRSIHHPVWTQAKAKLIERYLYYFALVTKHGTYLDAFAGPQEPDKPEMWAAKLVLESEPRWFRHFHFFELDERKVTALESLKAAQPPPNRAAGVPKRDIHVRPGDVNVELPALLEQRSIGEREATFCLLDQRTFQCDWATVQALAKYKRGGHKIELFYFFANAWLDRALAALRDTERLQKWWGAPDWDRLRQMRRPDRLERMRVRFESELGYASVTRWPIYDKAGGKRLMYYMIHATDHPDAPLLMRRAYEKAVQPKEPEEQLLLDFRAQGLLP